MTNPNANFGIDRWHEPFYPMSPMGQTTQVAKDREGDATRTVVPTEYARGIHMRNPPSLQALKLMHLMIATAGGRMADDVRHELRLADIRAIDGFRNHDRKSLQPLLEELRTAVLSYDEPDRSRYVVGGLLDEATVDYRHEESGDVRLSWYFGRTFRTMAEASNHWAILDRQTVFHLGSKYAVLLFQFVASLSGLDSVSSRTFSLPELRAILGVATGKLDRFADMHRRALQPAVDEINHLSRFTLTVKPQKEGRTVTSVKISWREKADTNRQKRELAMSKVGRKARRQAAEETIVEPPQAVRWRERPALAEGFPVEGPISFGPWGEIARNHLRPPRRDVDLVASDFRQWVAGRDGMTLSSKGIEKAFVGFCKRVEPVK